MGARAQHVGMVEGLWRDDDSCAGAFGVVLHGKVGHDVTAMLLRLRVGISVRRKVGIGSGLGLGGGVMSQPTRLVRCDKRV